MKLKQQVAMFPPGTEVTTVHATPTPENNARAEAGMSYVRIDCDDSIMQCWLPSQFIDWTPTILNEELIGSTEPDDPAPTDATIDDISAKAADEVMRVKPESLAEMAQAIRSIIEPYEVEMDSKVCDSNRLRRKWRGLCVGQINRIRQLEKIILAASKDSKVEERPHRRLPLKSVLSLLRKLDVMYQDQEMESSV